LAARQRALEAGVTAVEASYLYLLLLREESESKIDHQRLNELLGTGVDCAVGQRVWIAPRVGTQSPWSSKATDILHNTGFAEIEQIERARVVNIISSREGNVTDLRALSGALHDRMTESVFFESAEELHSLFAPREQKALGHIDVLGQGAAAIVTADRELGLSLASDEIEYLVAEFLRLERRPTANTAATRYSMQAGRSMESGSRARFSR
jgi:phosphoribosylformylglycinamidine synthase